VSGQGIFKALRGGIFASYAIADSLRGGDQGAVARFRSFVADEFATYREKLNHYYGLERRWPDRPFWRRRAGALHSREVSYGQSAQAVSQSLA
jgi:hypothetical protein